MTENVAPTRPIGFAVFSIVAGLIGWFASFQLLSERLKFLADPNYVPNCDLSVLVTCGPNMSSWQGSLLGFTNTAIGVSLFVVPIIVGFSLLARARFDGWWWMLYQLGNFIGYVFITWLFAQSVYVLGTLCPWCIVIWMIMIPLWWVNIFRPFAQGDIPLPGGGRQAFSRLYSWAWVIVLANYVVLAMLAQVQLDWLGELVRFLS
jgi:uncharacterized membrane protein